MAKNIVNEIRKATRRKFTAEDKIRIVLEGLRGQIVITELARREGIAPSVYYRWSKAFLESGKNGLTKDTHRDATTDEVRESLQRMDPLWNELFPAERDQIVKLLIEEVVVNSDGLVIRMRLNGLN